MGEESIKILRAQYQSDLDAVDRYESRNKSRDGLHGDYDTVMRGENDINEEASAETTPGPNISLLAKWIPRENSHFDKKLGFLKRFLQQGEKDEREGWESNSRKNYRKRVAKLTSYMSLPEVLLSAQRSDEIDFHKMASRATLKLSAALLNETKNGLVRRPNDRKRQRCAEMFVDHLVREGLKGGALMPDEIVAEIMRGKVSPSREKVLEAQWKDLWNNVVEQARAKAKEEGVDFDPSKMVPLSDVSGSMCGKPMEVAIAMGIGISEITHPAFRNMVLTFESNPQWHKLMPGDSIVKKVRSLQRAAWGGSTNFEAAYDKIMEVCVDHKLSKVDVPSLIVFSDMQFDLAHQATGYNWDRKKTNNLAPMHDVIRSKFADTARKLNWHDSDPTPMIYWNLRDTGSHPVEKDTQGTVLLSGFSPSMLKQIMNGEALEDKMVEVVEADGTVRTEKVRVTPSEVLRKMLDDSLYDPVREILVESNEGVFMGQNPITSSIDKEFVII